MFKTRFRVSWVDTDSARIVHFSNYFRYFERAEEELYNSLGINFIKLQEKYGYNLPRLEAYCRYYSPLKFNDLVEVRIFIDEIREKTIKYKFEIHNLTESKKAAEGHVVVVAADMEQRKSVPLNKEFINALLKAVK